MVTRNYAQSDVKICIIGDLFTQNELLIRYIIKRTGIKCKQQPDIQRYDKNENKSDSVVLYLIDSKSAYFYTVWDEFETKTSLPDNHFVALFNLDENHNLGVDAIKKGIQGIFCNNEPIGIITKAIKNILNGELWYPRRTFSQYLGLSIIKKKSDIKEIQKLTEREKEILKKLFLGKSNTEIAKQFCISYSTVKTHLYNIYKKINVGNRISAKAWASSHLEIRN